MPAIKLVWSGPQRMLFFERANLSEIKLKKMILFAKNQAITCN